MWKITFSIVVITMISPAVGAQKYTTAAGLRIGGGFGITVQQALWKNYTAEGIIQKGFTSKRTTITALLEQHHPIAFKGLNFYLGAGPHIATYGNSYEKEDKGMAAGISAIGGLEIKLGSTLLSADFKPALSFGAGPVFDSQTGLSLRYVFIKAKKKEHKWMFWKRWSKKES